MLDNRDVRIAALENDLAEARRALAEMTQLAHIDALSGLPNRRSFEAELRRAQDRALRYQEKSAVAVFDIDEFKLLNDRYGHAAGDAAIIAIGSCLRDNIRASDFVGRIGGDEFAVVLQNIDLMNAQLKISAIGISISNLKLCVDREIIRISASAGVAAIESIDDVDAINRADMMMYRQKRRSKIVYHAT